MGVVSVSWAFTRRHSGLPLSARGVSVDHYGYRTECEVPGECLLSEMYEWNHVNVTKQISLKGKNIYKVPEVTTCRSDSRINHQECTRSTFNVLSRLHSESSASVTPPVIAAPARYSTASASSASVTKHGVLSSWTSMAPSTISSPTIQWFLLTNTREVLRFSSNTIKYLDLR